MSEDNLNDLPEDINLSEIKEQISEYAEKISGNQEGRKFWRGLEEGLSEDQLKRMKRESDYKGAIDDSKHLRTVQRITLTIISCTGILASVLITITWVLHLILPEKWRWLPADSSGELNSLVAIILSYTAGIFAKIGIKKDK